MTNALTEDAANRNEQASRMRTMWSAVALTLLNDAIHQAAREPKKQKGMAMMTLAMWANTKDGRKVLSLAGIDPDKRVIDGMLAFAAKGVTVTQQRKKGVRM